MAAAAPPNPRLSGTPFVSSWDSKDYGIATGHYHVVQHPQSGFVYFGSHYGVLEFDGASWRVLNLPSESGVPVLVIDCHGTIWLGSSNAVALLQPDAKGELQPVDVTGRLPEAEQVFGRLYLGAASPDGVYLASPTQLLFFGDNGTTRTWPSGPEIFNGLCWFDGALHVSRGRAGMARLEHGEFVDVAPPPRSPNLDTADSLRLFAVRRDVGAADALLLTDVGPMRWAGPGQPVVPLPAAPTSFFENDRAVAATVLRDGRFAFSLRRQGLLILDSDGAFSSLLDSSHGIPRGQIQHLATDDQGGLWLAQVNGIARLQLESRFTTQTSLEAARAFLRRGDRLYIAHDAGVVWREDVTGELHPISGFPNAPGSFVAVGDRIFGTGQYLREITADDRAVIALPVQLNSLTALPRFPGTFVGGSVRGLRVLHFDGAQWSDGGLVTGVNASVREVQPDDEGYIWAEGYAGADSWRVDFRAGPDLDAAVERFDAAKGLPNLRGSGARWLTGFGGELMALRDGKLLRYDRGAGRFVPEEWVKNLPSVDRLFLAEGGTDELWGFAPGPPRQIVHLLRTAENRWRAEQLSASPLFGIPPTGLYYDGPGRTLWMGNRGSAVTMDPDWRPLRPAAPLRAVIRGLSTASGELLMGGAQRHQLRLDPVQNSLRVAFAASSFVPDLRGTIRTDYRTRLEGLEPAWTVWSHTPWREFTDLPYRDYVIHVQARDLDGNLSTVDSFAFSIAPPWWLARPTLAIYALLVLLGFGGFFRLRTRALQRRNEQLEDIVLARTAELERLRRLEMDEKISARLAEEKARLEVLRYQLNPHFLFNSLNSIYTLVWSHSRPAGDLVRRLAEFCRMTLTRRNAETATLAEEFGMLRAYLDLEQLRWGESLQVEVALAPELTETRLPPFLLLPLVENAVKYGGHTSPDLLKVRLIARPEAGDAILIEVANTGTWLEPGAKPEVASSGIGLDNLRQRLARHYPGTHEFKIVADDGWVTVRLQLGTCRVQFEPVVPVTVRKKTL